MHYSFPIIGHSAFHPSVVGKWVPASAGKAKAGMVHSVSGWTRGVQVKLWDPLSWERVPYLSALEVRSRRGAIQIHVYLYLYLYLIQVQIDMWVIWNWNPRKPNSRCFMNKNNVTRSENVRTATTVSDLPRENSRKSWFYNQHV